MKSSEHPVAASGPSSFLMMLLTKSLRALFIQRLLLAKPAGGKPSPSMASNRAARNRESPSPSLPSVFAPYHPRPCSRMNCSVISDVSR